MSKIKPFRGYLPPNDLAKNVSCPPYDVLSSDEARDVVRNNAKSFLRVIKPEVDFANTIEGNDEFVHQRAHRNLSAFIREGLLIRDKEECFYLYSISKRNHFQTGLVAAVSVEEYNDQKIKKHEHTRPEKEDDRTLHISTTRANTGPVFLVFKNDGSFQSLISRHTKKKSVIYFEASDGTSHSIKKIEDKSSIKNIKKYFKSVDNLYIADGHHRAASASRFQRSQNGSSDSNYFLGTLFPHDEVQILSYNRVVRGLDGFQNDLFLNKIKKNFSIVRSNKKKPIDRGIFMMYLDGKWFNLEAKEKIRNNDPVLGLDASILQNFILDLILDIKDPRTDSRLDFIGGSKGLDELERRCEMDAEIAFALHPVTIDDLLKVSDNGKVMPPKSTWFEPKLRSGLIVRMLD